MNNNLEFDSVGASIIPAQPLQNGASLKNSFGGSAVGGNTLVANMGKGMQEYLAGIMQPVQPIALQTQQQSAGQSDTLFGAGIGLVQQAINDVGSSMGAKPAHQIAAPKPQQPGPMPFGM